MPSKSKTPVFIAIIGFLLLGMVALNAAAGRFGKEPEAPPPPEQAQQNEPAEPAATAPETVGSELVRLPADSTTGPSSAPREIVIGWTWTPEVQADPSKVSAAIDQIKKAVPDAKVRVVNVDAVPTAPAGITVDGKTVAELAPDGSLNPQEAVHTIQEAAGVPHAH